MAVTAAQVQALALAGGTMDAAANINFTDGGSFTTDVADGVGVTGFNFNTNEFVDMIVTGVVDPAKVSRSTLENAASIASLLLTTETLITIVKEDKDTAPMGGMPGRM